MISLPTRCSGIRLQLAGLALAVALPPIAVLWHLASEGVARERSEALEAAAERSRDLAHHIDDDVDDAAKFLLAVRPAIVIDGDAVVATNSRRLQASLEGMPNHYDRVAVFDADGRNIGVASRPTYDRPLPDVRDRDYFLAIRGGADRAVGRPVIGPAGDRVDVTVARPILDPSARTFAGVITVELSLEHSSKPFRHPDAVPGIAMRIGGVRGVILERGESGFNWRESDLFDDPWIGPHLGSDMAAREVVWSDGRSRLTASASAAGNSWLVSIGIPPGSALAGVERTYRHNLLLGVSAAAWALLASWLVSRHISRPIRQLREDARILATGDLGHRSAVRAAGEIGELAATFNEMAGRVMDESLGRRRLAEKLNAIIDASPIPILAADRDANATLWNKAAERLWGYRAEEVLGRPIPIRRPDADDGSDILFRRVLEGEAILGMDRRRWRKDGRPVDTLLYAAPLPDPDGGTAGVVSMWLDRTEQNALEARLRQSAKMEAVAQLAGGIAHDINNVLGAIVANLDLLRESSAGRPDDVESVDAALGAALEGADLVQKLLSFSRRQPLELQRTDLVGFLEAAMPRLRAVLGEKVTVELDLSAGLWEALVDPEGLATCLLDLASNARDAMPGGGRVSIGGTNVTVDGTLASINPNLRFGDYAVLSVIDTGTGISADALRRVFEPFFTTKEVGQGHGLGLTAVFGYMRQIGGSAQIYSEVGHGTSVKLYLPRAKGPTGPVEDRPVDDAPASADGKRILVVDDNADMRGASVAMLESLGYRTVEADSAEAALEAIDRDGAFDLVFSDIVMSGAMTGIDLAREGRRRGLRTLLTSGFASPVGIYSDAIEQGLEVLGKPFRKADLAARVRALLDPGAAPGTRQSS